MFGVIVDLIIFIDEVVVVLVFDLFILIKVWWFILLIEILLFLVNILEKLVVEKMDFIFIL